jgi:hypothetical protein
VLHMSNCFNSYLSFVPFMFHSSFFSLITTPFKMICLLFNLPLALIKGIFWVVLFLP